MGGGAKYRECSGPATSRPSETVAKCRERVAAPLVSGLRPRFVPRWSGVRGASAAARLAAAIAWASAALLRRWHTTQSVCRLPRPHAPPPSRTAWM